ncbi:AAA family ATPase [Verrucomicrobiota bacterium]
MSKVIAVTGKGGTGKTTVVSLIIKHLKAHAQGTILALDADPDSNLATVLGVPLEMSIGQLREETLKEMKNFPPGMDKSNYIEAGLHQIICETDKMDFIAMGRSEGPGCYCYINSLLRKFADDLQSSYDWVIMDNEAGLEHLSRRTAARVDHLITIINNTPLSIDCARRVQDLLGGISNEVRKKHYIINNVNSEKVSIIKERCADLDMEYLGCIPPDPELEDAIFNGKPLFELDTTPAVLSINEMMDKIKEK